MTARYRTRAIRTIGKPNANPVRPRRSEFSPAITAAAAAAFVSFSSSSSSVVVGSSFVPCNVTSDCEGVFRVGSTCDGATGTCTNAFEGGCLRRILGEDRHPRLRTCNSDDRYDGDDDGDELQRRSSGGGGGGGGGLSSPPRRSPCEPSALNYEEIRIYNENWESAMFLSWIVQIWLSEFMDVPVTIETGSSDLNFNFYDRHNSFDYAVISHNYDAHMEAGDVGDCRRTDKPCAHMSMEVWVNNERFRRSREDGHAEPSIDGNGMVGRIALFIPKITARRDPSLLVFYGLRGDENRRKVADTFKRPTSFGDYCRDVSESDCAADDGVASRPPLDDEEGGSYFVPGAYIGHFRHTEENDCDANPTNCTGHVADVPSCDWTTHTEAQMHWNDIPLRSNGPAGPNDAYSYSQLTQIWEAANATRSDVIMYWWYPETTLERYRGTDYEFQQVMLPQATRECVDLRTDADERCSSDPTVRRGRAGGGCDYEINPLQKYISASLGTRTAAVPAASRSPAYDASKLFVVSNVAMEDLLKEWATSDDGRVASDRYGHGAREVVCSWVVRNREYLEFLLPRGYPRTVVREEELSGGAVIGAAGGVAGLSTAMVLATSAATYHWRKKRVIAWARVEFLGLTLFGFLLVSAAAFVVLTEPSLPSCTAAQWLITLGYTVVLVPLLVKVAAINRLMNGATEMRRMKVSLKGMFLEVAMAVVLVLVYLSAWTAIDPMTEREEHILADEGRGIVTVGQTCASSSGAWVLVTLVWQVLLLLCAAVLAFQSRNIIQDFNESSALGMMVYTHLLFFAVRTLFYYLDDIQAEVRSGTISLLLSADTIINLVMYFGRKFLAAAADSGESGLRRGSLRSMPQPHRYSI